MSVNSLLEGGAVPQREPQTVFLIGLLVGGLKQIVAVMYCSVAQEHIVWPIYLKRGQLLLLYEQMNARW